MNPLSHWDNAILHHLASSGELQTSLEVMYAEKESPIARAFLEQALKIAERALEPGFLDSEKHRHFFPENRGEATRVKVYAESLLGRGTDWDALRSASHDFANYCNAHSPSEWGDQIHEPTYMSAVRTALVAGDRAFAAELLQARTMMVYHNEAALLATLAGAKGSAYRDAPSPGDKAWRERFDTWFDTIRDPDYYPKEFRFLPLSMLRFEVGAIRRRAFATLATHDDWQAVIEDISA